jgi:hypothetical protein
MYSGKGKTDVGKFIIVIVQPVAKKYEEKKIVYGWDE